MPTFGFSAFIKLILLNETQRRRAIALRLYPQGDGYDFHRSFKLRARKLLLGLESAEEIISSAGSIKGDAERRSAQTALCKLAIWQRSNPGEIVEFPNATFQSPSSLFQVKFEPNFGMRLGHKLTAVHIWNNAKPPFSDRPVYPALSLALTAFKGQSLIPEDVAVLALKSSSLHRLSDVADQAASAQRLVNSFEELIRELKPATGEVRSPFEDRPAPVS